MRVSTKALATVPALFFFASCVTPPPLPSGPGYRTAEARPPRDAAVVPASYGSEQDRYGDRYRDPEPRYGYDDGEYDPRYDDRGNYSPRPSARLQLLLGRRDLDDSGFEPTDEPGILGFEFSQVPEVGGLGFEFGINFGYDDDDNVFVPGVGNADLELAQAEIYAGMRAEFGQGNVRPYIGGGGAFMSTTTTVKQGFLEAEEDDSTLGAYIHGGIQVDINEAFFLGLDYRHMFGSEYEVGGVDYDSDYDQIAFTLGFNL